jgi:hypothetical protein
MTDSAAVMPWTNPFNRDRALPAAVRGPVDFFALARLASIFRCEQGGRGGESGEEPAGEAGPERDAKPE